MIGRGLVLICLHEAEVVIQLTGHQGADHLGALASDENCDCT